MNTRVDKFGRVVIPKSLRKALRLGDGASIRIIQIKEGLLLEPTQQEPVLKRKGEVLVYTGEGEDFDLEYAVERSRVDRIEDLSASL
ncbi:MAG: AbrB/MazE/SpoVT family DNA-binding domain-containing protein [Patescibacteria group bacterium]